MVLLFLSIITFVFGAFAPISVLETQHDVRVEIIRPWFDMYSENPIIPMNVIVDNRDNFTKALRIEVVSTYLDATKQLIKENNRTITLPPLSQNNVTSQTERLFEGKWITEVRLFFSNREIYNDSFFSDIVSPTKWVTTNVIPLSAIGSSVVAIIALFLQSKNSKDMQKNMKEQVTHLESELDFNKNRMIQELRPWISKRTDKGISEHDIPNGIKVVTLYFSNFGKTPALNVKFKRKIIYFDPNSNSNIVYGNLFNFQSEDKIGEMGHIMPDQEFQITYQREGRKEGTLIVNEFEYDYFDKKSTYRFVVSLVNQPQKSSLRKYEYEYAN